MGVPAIAAATKTPTMTPTTTPIGTPGSADGEPGALLAPSVAGVFEKGTSKRTCKLGSHSTLVLPPAESFEVNTTHKGILKCLIGLGSNSVGPKTAMKSATPSKVN